MGKLTVFEIRYAQPNPVYYAGQTVTGHVNMVLSEPLKMKGIVIEFLGKAYVHWTERHSHGSGKNRRTSTRHYSASEVYFYNKVILFGNEGGLFADSTMHPAGSFTFPFSIHLPQNLPSSFEGDYGHVRYSIKCNIDRPWKFDHKTKSAFTVISVLDLNQVSDAMSALQNQGSKTFCCLCCASAPVEAVVRLDRKGYVPGESISINAEVTNGSNRVMDSTQVKLIQTVWFRATTKSRPVTRTIAVKKHDRIEEGGSQTWSGEKLHIPPLPPSFLVGCNIIDIHYQVLFVVDPSGPAYDLNIPLDITIGTIPLRSYFAPMSAAASARGFQPLTDPGSWYAPSASPQPGLPSAPVMPGPPPGAGPGPNLDWYGPSGAMEQPSIPSAPVMPGAPPDAPPPSYMESVFGRVDIHDEDDNEHTRGDLNFAPVYPYYNWDNKAYSLPE